MSEIDTSGWGEFRVGDLFEVRPTKAYKLTNASLFDGGDNPVVVNSSQNNGIGGFTAQELTEEAGAITFSDTTDAGSIFYQGSAFVGYPHVQRMRLLDGSKQTDGAMYFVAAVFGAVARAQGYSYGNKFRRDAAAELILRLPATSAGDPDWDAMEAMMGAVLADRAVALDALAVLPENGGTVIDTSGWGEFRVGDLFDLKKGSRLTSLERKDGDIPYVGASQFNNGITQFISNDEKLHPAGVLTVCYNGPVGTTFYQGTEFWATDDVNVLYPKSAISKEALLFVAPMIESAGSEYAYVDKWKMSDMAATILHLPVTPAGDPDWDKMGSMMSQVLAERGRALDRLASTSLP